MSLKPSGVFISMSVPRRYVQKWAPWLMTPSRNAWPWTRLPMSRPCMSVMATTIVSIRPSRTIVLELDERGCLVVTVVVAHRDGLLGRVCWMRGPAAVPAGPRCARTVSGYVAGASSPAACSNSRSISVSSASVAHGAADP